MLRPASLGSLAALWLVAVGPIYSLSGKEKLLDVETGVVDGRTAIAIYPMRYEGRKAAEVLGTEGCTVHLKSRESFEVQERPCGKWFVVPPDQYDYWVETDWQVSRYSRKFIYFGGEFKGQGILGGASLDPAGRVTLPAGFERTPDLQLRLLNAETPGVDGLMRRSISRRLTFEQVGEYQLMPEGRTIAAVWDVKADRYVMLSRPFHLKHRETIQPPLAEPPADNAQLIAQVVRNVRVGNVSDDQLRLSALLNGREIPPDVRFGDAERVYGIWYQLEPGTARLLAQNRGDELQAPVEVVLEPGRIARAIGKMLEAAKGPSLDVEVELPSEIEHGPMQLSIRELPGKKLVESVALETEALGPLALETGAWSASFSNLPLAVVAVELKTPLGLVRRSVNLTSGGDAYLRIAPELIVVQGTVYLGGEQHPATLEATTVTRETLDASSGPDGRYELIALQPIQAISADPFEGAREPFVEIYFDAIRSSTELDLEIPDNEYDVHVVDALSGRPVEGAKVTSMNRYGDDQGKAISQYVSADADGVARLPALRAGQVELTVEAEGYLALETPVVHEVSDDADSANLTIALRPEGAKAQLTLVLPSGMPARGATVYVLDANGTVQSEGSADPDGNVWVAAVDQPGALLLARHEAAAFHMEPWLAEAGETARRQLQAPAQPLRVRVTEALGDAPVRHARLGIWIHDHLITDRALYRLTGQKPLADEHGYWTVHGLPQQQPVAVVAWRSALEVARIRAMATEVAPPWSDTVSIRLVGDS